MVRRLIVALVLVLAIAGSTSGVATRVSPAHATSVAAPTAAHAALFDKTRVVLHLAVAYGVFHHWVYTPFRAGQLSIHHPLKLVKAGLALLFAVHEVKQAIAITSHSSSPTLKALNTVLVGIGAKFQSVGALFKSDPASLTDGQVSSSIGNLNSQVVRSNSILHVPDAPVSALGNFS